MSKIARIFVDVIRLFLVLTSPLSDFILDGISTLFIGKGRILPPVDDEILLLSATELANRIRKKELSAVEVMEAYVRRESQPYINAITDERFEVALLEAREVDEVLSLGGKSEEELKREKPLLGVPFTCKESMGIAGMRQTLGLVSRKNTVCDRNHIAAQLYLKAGAIPFAVTNVSQFLSILHTTNPVFGTTPNPFDIRRSIGGSSGGEAALITSAASIIGLDNDLLGSIRLPAAFGGIYGHKPSRGLVPNEAPASKTSPDEFKCTGPMCRYSKDLPLLMKVLSSGDGRVPWDEEVDFHQVRIYFLEQLPGLANTAVDDVKKSVLRAVHHFESKFNCRASSLHLPDLKHGFTICECKLLEQGRRNLKDRLTTANSCLWTELMRCILGRSDFKFITVFRALAQITEKDGLYLEMLQKCRTLQREMEEIFQEDCLLILPTFPEPPPHRISMIFKEQSAAYTAIFNLLGLPSTQVMAGLSEGLPIGIQVVSGKLKDHLTIAAAIELDTVFNGWQSPCDVVTK